MSTAAENNAFEDTPTDQKRIRREWSAAAMAALATGLAAPAPPNPMTEPDEEGTPGEDDVAVFLGDLYADGDDAYDPAAGMLGDPVKEPPV